MVETVSPLREHFGDEHVVGVDPPIRPNTGTFWRRRIRPFTGRALSHTALEAEQVSQGGMQRLRGQSVSHGTIDGLAVAAARGAIGTGLEDARVLVGEGLGLTRSGEDVALPADRSLRLADLPTIARVDLGDEGKTFFLSANVTVPERGQSVKLHLATASGARRVTTGFDSSGRLIGNLYQSNQTGPEHEPGNKISLLLKIISHQRKADELYLKTNGEDWVLINRSGSSAANLALVVVEGDADLVDRVKVAPTEENLAAAVPVNLGK